MLNEDVISIIKEYAGITSLDIVNAFYELKRTMNDDELNKCYDKPNITKIRTLLEWIPILYKPSKKYESGKFEKHYLEMCLWQSLGYVSRNDTVIAFKLLFPMQIINGIAWFQAKRQTSAKISKFIKVKLNSMLQISNIEPHYMDYINGMVSHKLIGKCKCGASKNLDNYKNVMLCRPCIYQSMRRN